MKSIIIYDAFNSMDSLPMIEDLDCKLTTEELSKAIGLTAPFKTPSIPADLLQEFKSCLLTDLFDSLVKC